MYFSARCNLSSCLLSEASRVTFKFVGAILYTPNHFGGLMYKVQCGPAISVGVGRSTTRKAQDPISRLDSRRVREMSLQVFVQPFQVFHSLIPRSARQLKWH